MKEPFIRSALLFGDDNMQKIFNAKVAVFGIGGVGGYAVEALARSGIGRMALFDSDTVALSNINRQLHATYATQGQYKVEVAKARIHEINPDAQVDTHIIFYTPETASAIDLSGYDYIIDAIDTVSGKIELAVRANACGVPLISAMGAGNKLDPTAFQVTDIYKTSMCPLAKIMRHELRKRGIAKLKVVYSEEPTVSPTCAPGVSANISSDTASPEMSGIKPSRRRQVPGSNAFVPPVVGMILAGEVVKDICQIPKTSHL